MESNDAVLAFSPGFIINIYGSPDVLVLSVNVQPSSVNVQPSSVNDLLFFFQSSSENVVDFLPDGAFAASSIVRAPVGDVGGLDPELDGGDIGGLDPELDGGDVGGLDPEDGVDPDVDVDPEDGVGSDPVNSVIISSSVSGFRRI